MASSDPNSNVLQGTKSLYMNGWISPTSVSQIGDVPAGTKSIRFLARTNSSAAPILTMDGQSVPLVTLSNNGGLFTFGGDISAWAGMNSELRIAAPAFSVNVDPGVSFIDAIEFSPTAIPEPGSLSILVATGVCLMRRRITRSL